jgi:selenium-binding protein 1
MNLHVNMSDEGHVGGHGHLCGPGYATPLEAMNAEREKILYVNALYTGTGIEEPDYLATIDVDPASPTYAQVICRTPMPSPGDELHHFGWNACSSCHSDAAKKRRFLIIPGFRSSRIHIVDTEDPRSPRLVKVIEAEEVMQKTNLSAPHTVHCLAIETATHPVVFSSWTKTSTSPGAGKKRQMECALTTIFGTSLART